MEIPKTERDFNVFFTKERKKTVTLLCGKYKLSPDAAEDVYSGTEEYKGRQIV